MIAFAAIRIYFGYLNPELGRCLFSNGDIFHTERLFSTWCFTATAQAASFSNPLTMANTGGVIVPLWVFPDYLKSMTFLVTFEAPFWLWLFTFYPSAHIGRGGQIFILLSLFAIAQLFGYFLYFEVFRHLIATPG